MSPLKSLILSYIKLDLVWIRCIQHTLERLILKGEVRLPEIMLDQLDARISREAIPANKSTAEPGMKIILNLIVIFLYKAERVGANTALLINHFNPIPLKLNF